MRLSLAAGSGGVLPDGDDDVAAEGLDAYLRTHQQAAQPVAAIGYVYCFNEDNEDGDVPHPKSHLTNMKSVAANYQYFAAKYGTPITRLVIDHHVFAINDVIREKNLPDCADYLAGRSGPQ